MKPKHQRLLFLVCALAMFAGAAALILKNFNEQLVFFYSPTTLQEKKPGTHAFLRLGGLVEAGSLTRGQDGRVSFRVTDRNRSVRVLYQGELPALFREGQGVVAEGRMDGQGLFNAQRILAKHDETYMPPEVAKALKAQGRWKEGE